MPRDSDELPTDEPPINGRRKRPYGGLSWKGVPFTEIDRMYAAERLREVYGGSPQEAVQILLENNERIISRCGLLITFSGILMAVYLFIATNPKFLPTVWQECGFYGSMFVWVVFTLRLLWSLKHELPPPWDFGTEEDFKFTARLYLKRMGRYNSALLVTVICFVAILCLLAPVTAVISDYIFNNYR
jgi:hypothetical protein